MTEATFESGVPSWYCVRQAARDGSLSKASAEGQADQDVRDLHSHRRQVCEKNTELHELSARCSAPTVCRKSHFTFDLYGSRVRQSKTREPEGQDLHPKGVHAIISRAEKQFGGQRWVNGVPPIMNGPAGQAKAIDSLRSLLERLGSPELTLPEAKFLRSQISRVLGEIGPDRDRSQVYP